MHAFGQYQDFFLKVLNLWPRRSLATGKNVSPIMEQKCGMIYFQKLSRRRPCFASKNIVVSFLLIFDASVIRL